MTALWRRLPLLVTGGLLLAMYAEGVYRYEGFSDPQVVLNLFVDNGFLLVTAVGMTMVILSGGIDLSVGAVAGFTTMLCAWLVAGHGWPALAAMPMALAVGAIAGACMGAAIHYLQIQPFIVTLAGLFLFRGLCFMISTESIPIVDPALASLAGARFYLPGGSFVPPSVLFALAVLGVAAFVLHATRFGRRVRAIGGNEQSALLMGVPVARTKIAVYAVSGFCSALAGLLYVLYTQSGDGVIGVGLELDAIAVVVIGGTLLTGGVGNLAGTLLGVLVLGLIKTILSFEGTLSSWWTKIFVGSLLLVFILLQRLIVFRRVPASQSP